METFLIKALQLMLAFAILVVVHEFGHYLFARIFGVKVEKFYLFFNPWFTLFKYHPKKKAKRDPNKASWRDTEYGIGWLPLGGYVKIAGMIDESMDKEQMKQPMQNWEFRAKPAYQRLLIMTAGVIFNFILAIIIYAGIVFYWGEAYVPYKNAKFGMEYCDAAHKVGFVDGDIPLAADGKSLEGNPSDNIMDIINAENVTVLRNNDTIVIPTSDNLMKTILENDLDGKTEQFMTYAVPVKIEKVEKGMGAYDAGLKEGDLITAVNNTPAPSYNKFIKILEQNKGTIVPIKYLRNDSIQESSIQISDNGKIGIMLSQRLDDYYTVEYNSYSFLESIPRGIELGVDKLVGYVGQMKMIFTKEGAQSLGGFGAIGSIFPESWNWMHFWEITAFLSIILAFMNILPIPALDGGHVLFLLVEIITRRKPSEKFLEYAQMAGMIFLFILLIYANGNDIYRFIFK